MESGASPDVTIGGRSLTDVRSVNLRSIARPANAEPPRAVKRLPRPSETCRRVPFSTARPTDRLRRSYASITRRVAGDLRRQSVRPSKSAAAIRSKPKAIITIPPRVDNGQRLVLLHLLRACEPESLTVSHRKMAD